VRRGDSLWTLSGRYLGDPNLWPRIFEANRGRIEDPDLISPGQRLDIPAAR
jgi:nucleoid-associated protein YgaU